jgi:UDP-N-acetyl-D-mannosaminuronic acid transferase (WecB/TagA/CpsF family)
MSADLSKSPVALVESLTGVANGVDFTIGEGTDIATGTTTGTKIGSAATQKVGFWGATPVVQPASAAQAAVATTPAATSSYGFSEAQANAIVALVNALRAALVSAGIIKGAA